MKKVAVKVLVIVLALFLFLSGAASAHQPRIVPDTRVEVTNPQISQAFYGELNGAPVEYRIQSKQKFNLYIGVLVPDTPGVSKNISAEILRIKNGKPETIAKLDGTKFNWTPFFEEFARDNYFWGPEFAADDSVKGVDLKGRPLPAGDYRIRVFNPGNKGKYSLTIGYLEVFPPGEILNTLTAVPQIKHDFFDKPLWTVIISPFGAASIIIFYLAAFAVVFVWRLVMKKLANDSARGAARNIGSVDRLLRAVIGAALLIWAVNTTWNPVLIFLSGFFIFEAVFSWCGFYAAFGINTYPANQ